MYGKVPKLVVTPLEELLPWLLGFSKNRPVVVREVGESDMPKRVRNRELEILHKSSRRGAGYRDARQLPPFHSPRAPKHTKIAGRGSHKAKKG